jgi:serine/threonine protein kinase
MESILTNPNTIRIGKYDCEFLTSNFKFETFISHENNSKKKLTLFKFLNFENVKSVTSELFQLKIISQKNKYIEPFHDYFPISHDFVVVLDENFPTLFEILSEQQKKQKYFSFQEIIDYSLQLSEGFSWIHQNKVYHGNLHSKNVISTKEGFKIFLKIIPGLKIKNIHSTISSILNHNNFPLEVEKLLLTSTSDIYSLGCLILEMMTLKPFVKSEKLEFQSDYKSDFIELILQMTDSNFKKRPKMKTILQKIKQYNIQGNMGMDIPDDIYLNICWFLTPKEVVKTLMSTNKSLYQLCSSDLLWKEFYKNFTYYTPGLTPQDYNKNNYKEVYFQNPWKFSKKFSKGMKINKSFTTVENPVRSELSTDLKLAHTNESLASGKFLIRVLYEESNYGCFVGIVSKASLPLAMKSEKEDKVDYIKYMRDGSIGGFDFKKGATLDRVRHVESKGLMKTFFHVQKGDVLCILLDMDNASVKFYINDDVECMITVQNLSEMKLNSPVHLFFGFSHLQKWAILDNIKKESDLVLGEVKKTFSI